MNLHDADSPQLVGTPSQIEWAEQIRPRVSAEFDRLAATLEEVAGKQSGRDRQDTQALVAILEEKRIEVLAKDQAGYFIRNWQELTDQVRLLIQKDSRYEAIKRAKIERAQTGEFKYDN